MRAVFTVTEDFPTPPLPDEIPSTRVGEPGRANGLDLSLAARSPRRCRRRPARSSSLIGVSPTSMSRTPGSASRAPLTRRSSSSRPGWAATGSASVTLTRPRLTLVARTIPSSVIPRRS